jgi:hypothetical protein
MYELAFPSSILNELGLDLFQRFRKLRLQKIVADSAYGFLFPPAIELRGAAIPRVNSTLHRANHDAIVYELKKTLRLLQLGHCFLRQILRTKMAACLVMKQHGFFFRKLCFLLTAHSTWIAGIETKNPPPIQI